MRIDVVTIFPAYLDPLRQSLPGKAIASGLVDLHVHDPRNSFSSPTQRVPLQRFLRIGAVGDRLPVRVSIPWFPREGRDFALRH